MIYAGYDFVDVSLKEEDSDVLQDKLYKDYQMRLEAVYKRLHEKEQRDLTQKTKEIYAITEALFQLSVPTATPAEMLLSREVVFKYIEEMLFGFYSNPFDQSALILAVCKYVRHKEISAIMTCKNVSAQEFMKTVPDALKKMLGAKHMVEVTNQCNAIKEEMLTSVLGHTNRVLRMTGAEKYYPWKPLTVEDIPQIEKDTASPLL